MTSMDPKSIRRGIVALVAAAVAAAALAIATAALRSVAAQPVTVPVESPSASATAASVLDHVAPSHKNKHVGIHAHGFVRDNGNFIMIDARRRVYRSLRHQR